MKSKVIVYKTRYGSSEKYAEWLSNSLKCDVYEMSRVKLERLKPFKTLIVISGTYAGRLPLVDFLKKHWKEFKDKRIIMVAVGSLPANNWWSRVTYWLIPGRIKRAAKYFKIYGRPPKNGEPIKKNNLKEVIDYIKRL